MSRGRAHRLRHFLLDDLRPEMFFVKIGGAGDVDGEWRYGQNFEPGGEEPVHGGRGDGRMREVLADIKRPDPVSLCEHGLPADRQRRSLRKDPIRNSHATIPRDRPLLRDGALPRCLIYACRLCVLVHVNLVNVNSDIIVTARLPILWYNDTIARGPLCGCW